jgi:hypothetical protein
MTAAQKYQAFISRLPAPGAGAHASIFGAGCCGCRAGLTPEQIFLDVRNGLPRGTREVGDKEITEGIAAGFKATLGEPGKVVTPKVKSQVAPGTLERLLKEGHGTTSADLIARSPIIIDWNQEESWRALGYLFGEDEYLFCGNDRTPGEPGRSIKTTGEWMREFEADGGPNCPKFICNPLTGESAPKQSGDGETFRGNGNVAAFRHCVVESDSLTLDQQLAFWATILPTLPVVSLTFSGAKSIHALLRVDCKDAAEWESQVAGFLYPAFLVPLGADKACSNPARLTRLPSYYRVDTRTIQHLLYLSPTGKAVCS